MKKSLRLKRSALIIAVLMVLTAFSLSGCGSQPGEKPSSDDAVSSEKTLNDEVLLTTEQVEQLLKDNGVNLVSDDSFNVDNFTYIWERSDTEKSEFKPAAYKIDGIDDVEILIYEFDEYISSNIAYSSMSEASEQLPDGFDFYSVYGKNIAVSPVPLKNLDYEDNTGNSEAAQDSVSAKALSKLRDDIFEILYNNAFNGKDLTYEGSKDGWSVIADVRQFKNIYSEGTSRDSISEYASGEVFVKRDGAQSVKDVLTEIPTFTWNGNIKLSKEAIDSLTKSDEHNGYFKISAISGNSNAFKYGTKSYTANINGDEVIIKLKK